MSFLFRSVEQDTLHHAYLMVGSLQSKKKQVAQDFLETLPAYDRTLCTLLDKENKEEKHTTISIDQIRDIIHSLTRISEEGKYRVIWIEPAEALTAEAANALLKVLEEPPHQTLFLLFAQSVRSVLPTIASRCHVLRFPSPKRKELIASHDLALDSDTYRRMETLMSGDSVEKLIESVSLSTDDFDAFECALERYIQNANNQEEYGRTVHSYLGLRESRRAYKNHVSETACIDLLHL